MILNMVVLQRVAPRRVVLMTAIVGAVIMGDSMLYNVLPSNITSFGVSAGLVGVILSANRFVRLVSNPMAAWFFQRFGLDKPLLLVILVSVGTTVAYGAGHGFVVLLLARLLWGVCYSMLRLGGYLMVLEDGRESTRGRLMGFFSGGQRTGSVLGVLLGGFLFDVTGRTASFLIIAALGLVSLPIPLALGRNRPRTLKVKAASVPADISEEVKPRGVRSQMARPHSRILDLILTPVPELDRVKVRQLLAVSVTVSAFYFAMNGVLVSTLGFFLSEELGEEGASIGGVVIGIATLNGLFLATSWASAMAAPYLGYVADRFGPERVIAIAAPMCLVSLVLLAFPGLLWLSLLSLPLAFVSLAAVTVSLDAMAGGLAPRNRRAKVMSRYATWQDSGSALGPLLAYAVLEFSSLTWVFAANALLICLAFAFFVTAFRGEFLSKRRASLHEDTEAYDPRDRGP
jgi:MFS family permease